MYPRFCEPLLSMWGLIDIPKLSVWDNSDHLVLFTNLVNFSAKVLNKDWYGAKEICIERLLNLNTPYIWSAQDIMTFYVVLPYAQKELPFGFHTRRLMNQKKKITEVEWFDTQSRAPEYLSMYGNSAMYDSVMPSNITEMLLSDPSIFPKCTRCGKPLKLCSGRSWRKRCC
jgi:hypothetical protein